MPLTIDHLPNYLLVSGSGLESLPEAQAHFRDLSSALVAKRRTGERSVRIMIDLSDAMPHPPEVAEHIGRALPVLYRDGDRVAVIVRSSALKRDTKSSHDALFSDVFLTREAAEEYLTRAG